MTDRIDEFDIGGWRCALHLDGPADGELVVAVHGFPDTARTFDSLRAALARDGFRVATPYTRGVSPSGPAPDNDYDPRRLSDDIVALIVALGRERAHLVGHDWGAVAAYLTALSYPDRVRRMVTAAVPPPRGFLHGAGPRQAARSWYMGFFQLPGPPDRLVGDRSGKFLQRLWRSWSPQWEFDQQEFADVARAFADPEVVAATLSYYRQMFSRLATVDGFALARRRIGVPTLLVAGSNDGCIGVELMERARGSFSGELEFLRLDAGHFMHREKPAAFNTAVAEFLRA